MADRRVVLVRCAAQFRHHRGRRKRAVGHLLTHVNVGAAEAGSPRAPEIELTGTPRDVFEVCGAVIVVGGVDSRAKVHGRLPGEIIMRVVAPCDPDVYSAHPTGTLTLKE